MYFYLRNISLSVDGNEDTVTMSSYLSAVIQRTTSIFVGGTSDPQTAVIAESFRGCMRNVEINGRYTLMCVMKCL